MHFTRIDYETWERQEIFEFFRTTVLYTTVHLEIGYFLHYLKDWGLRFYPAMIYCLAKVVNKHAEYRYGQNEAGEIGTWDRLDPLYTVPRRDKPELFSMGLTTYQPNFYDFYQAFLVDYEQAAACGRLFSKPAPPHTLGVTAMPELHFSSFAFGDPAGKPDFSPFVVLGKYEWQAGKTLLPVFGEFAHAVNDGRQISRFFRLLEETMQEFTTL